MPTTTSHLSMWTDEPPICLFMKEGFFVMGRVEIKARPSQRRRHTAHELMISPEWIKVIVTANKRRGKNVKVFASTIELTRRIDAFERACDARFELLFEAINQLIKSKVPKHRSIGSRAKSRKIRRRRRA